MYQSIELKNYTFISKPRRKKYYRKSGGIGAFISNDIVKHIKCVDSDSEYVLWLEYTNPANHVTETIFDAIYIPPVQSRFFTDDELDLLEREISNMCHNHSNVFLAGDFNAQTAISDDFTTLDMYLSNCLGFDDDSTTFLNQKAAFEKHNIPLLRANKDIKKIMATGCLKYARIIIGLF